MMTYRFSNGTVLDQDEWDEGGYMEEDLLFIPHQPGVRHSAGELVDAMGVVCDGVVHDTDWSVVEARHNAAMMREVRGLLYQEWQDLAQEVEADEGHIIRMNPRGLKPDRVLQQKTLDLWGAMKPGVYYTENDLYRLMPHTYNMGKRVMELVIRDMAEEWRSCDDGSKLYRKRMPAVQVVVPREAKPPVNKRLTGVPVVRPPKVKKTAQRITEKQVLRSCVTAFLRKAKSATTDGLLALGLCDQRTLLRLMWLMEADGLVTWDVEDGGVERWTMLDGQ
jgi:hypothetical protein